MTKIKTKTKTKKRKRAPKFYQIVVANEEVKICRKKLCNGCQDCSRCNQLDEMLSFAIVDLRLSKKDVIAYVTKT